MFLLRWKYLLTAAFPAIGVLLWLRRPDFLLNHQLWAEDGQVWLRSGMDYGFKAVFQPHSGYTQLLPKLVGAFFNVYTFYHAPLVFGLIALAVMALAMWLLLTDAVGGFLPRPWRVIAVAMMCLLPWYVETFGNLTGSQFYLFIAVALLCLADLNRLNRWIKAALLVFMFLACFSSPWTVLVVPVLAVRLGRHFRERDYVFLFSALSLAMIAANIINSRFSYDTAGGLASEFVLDARYLWPYLTKTFGLKTAGLTLFGDQFAYEHLAHPGGYVLLTVIFVLAAAVYVWRLARQSSVIFVRLGLLYFIVASILFSYASRRWNVDYFVIQDGYLDNSRYFLAPSLFLIIWLVDAGRLLWRGPKLIRVLPLALAAVFVVAAWQNFSFPELKDHHWRANVRTYYQRLLAPERKEREWPHTIEIAPGNWFVDLPVFALTVEQRERVEKAVSRLDYDPATEGTELEAFVSRFYQQCLGQSPGLAELSDWTIPFLRGAQSGASLAAFFVHSEGFKSRNTSDEEYVTILYRAFFGREPDEGGYNDKLRQLRNGVSRDDILDQFIYSPEFDSLCHLYRIKPHE
ncbi:MAG: DUF4214 domain-containing protein [Deltaproteobacteria bacterium]|nr:DUF4214 domain-containing protein [Deltaproteobacteria bacterium]